MDPLEKAVLNGSLFRGPRTPSPTRTASTSSEPSSSRSPSPSPFGDAGAAAGSSSSSSAHRRPGAANTGVKGVQADKAAHDAEQRAKRRRQLQKAQDRLQKLAISGGTWQEQEDLQRKEKKLREALAEMEKRVNGNEEEEDDEFGLDDEEDEEALRKYRAARIAELQGGGAKFHRLATHTTASPSVHYGHLRETDERGYVKAIEENEAGTTAVVVHIYSKLVPACHRLTAALTSLARSYHTTKFLQVKATTIGFGLKEYDRALDSDEDDDNVGESERRLRELEREESVREILPTLLIYQGGDLVGNLVRIDLEEDWGSGDERDVERLLKRFAAISLSGNHTTTATTFGGTADDDDDDEYE